MVLGIHGSTTTRARNFVKIPACFFLFRGFAKMGATVEGGCSIDSLIQRTPSALRTPFLILAMFACYGGAGLLQVGGATLPSMVHVWDMGIYGK